MHMHTCTPAHLHTCTPAHLHACTRARMHTCTHAHMHTCAHAHMHTCTHAHIHSYTLMHACTHAYAHAIHTLKSHFMDRVGQRVDFIKGAREPLDALIHEAYSVVEEQMLKILNFNFGTGKVVLIGGVQINMPSPYQVCPQHSPAPFICSHTPQSKA